MNSMQKKYLDRERDHGMIHSNIMTTADQIQGQMVN